MRVYARGGACTRTLVRDGVFATLLQPGMNTVNATPGEPQTMTSNQPKEVQNTTADPAPPPSTIESFVQTVWSKPESSTPVKKDDSAGATDSLPSPQGKVTDAINKVPTPTPEMPTPVKSGVLDHMNQGTVESEIKGPKEKPVFPRPGGFNNGEIQLNTKDAPPPTDAETPSEASLEAALATVADSKASDTAKSVASSILKGDVEGVQDVLQDLENDPEGEAKLKELAGELKELLGTRVSPNIGLDGKLGLSFLTQLSSTPVYEFEHQPGDPPRDRFDSSTTFTINSTGDARASQTVTSQRSFNDPAMRSVDAETEATRLQAIGVHAVNNRPHATKPKGDLGGIANPGGDTQGKPNRPDRPGRDIPIPGRPPRADMDKPVKGTKVYNELETLEVPPLNW